MLSCRCTMESRLVTVHSVVIAATRRVLDCSVNVCYRLVKMKEQNPEKTILLHCCCAPCAAPSAERLLQEGLQPLLFYSNPNIAPYREWEKRRDSMRILAEAWKLELFIEEYRHESWLSLVKGHEQEPERGARCPICFRRAIGASAALAEERGIGLFTTSLTLSPLKSAPLIFSIGKEYPGFSEWNFKKKNGVARSVELSQQLGLYRQNYCGCEFSLSAST